MSFIDLVSWRNFLKPNSILHLVHRLWNLWALIRYLWMDPCIWKSLAAFDLCQQITVQSKSRASCPKPCLCSVFTLTCLPYNSRTFLCILSQIWAWILCVWLCRWCVLSGQTSPSEQRSPVSSGVVLAEVRKVKSGAGSIPSLPRVLCTNLLVGSAQEQLNEESRAVPPGP